MLLWDEEDKATVLFHSVIFNSVIRTKYTLKIKSSEKLGNGKPIEQPSKCLLNSFKTFKNLRKSFSTISYFLWRQISVYTNSRIRIFKHCYNPIPPFTRTVDLGHQKSKQCSSGWKVLNRKDWTYCIPWWSNVQGKEYKYPCRTDSTRLPRRLKLRRLSLPCLLYTALSVCLYNCWQSRGGEASQWKTTRVLSVL